MIIGSAEVELRPAPGTASRFASSAEKDMQGGITDLAKKAAVWFAGAFVVKEGFDFVKQSIDLAESKEQGILKLNEALRANNATLGLNASAFDALNKQLGASTIYGAGASRTIEGQLALYHLTGAQIKELTPLVEDYAARTGKDVASAAQLAGAALLGKGRALKDVGINFKDLKDPTKNYVELVEGLRTQVGGFAAKEGETFGGRMKILSNQWHAFQTEIGEKVIPVLTKVLGVLGEKLPPILDFLASHTGLVVGVLVAGFTAWAVSATAAAVATIGATWPVLAIIAAVGLLVAGLVYAYTHWETFRAVVDAVASFLRDTLWPIIQQTAQVIVTVIGAAVDWFTTVAWPAIQTAATAIGVAFTVLAQVAADVFNAIVAAVHLLDPAIAWVRDQVIAPFEAWWNEHWGAIRQFFEDSWNRLVFVIQTVAAIVVPLVQAAFTLISDAVRIAMDVIVPVVQVAWQAVSGAIKVAMDVVVGVIRVGWDLISGIFTVARDVILGIVGFFLDLLTGKWRAALDDLKGMFTNVWHDISSTLSGVLGDIVHAVEGLARDVAGAAKGVGEAIVHGIAEGIRSLVGDIGQALEDVLKAALGTLPGPLKSIADKVLHFQQGGWVPGPPGAAVPAIVHGGEFVLSRDMLANMNAGGGGGGGLTVGPGAITLEFNVTGQPDPATLAAMGRVARASVADALESVADRRRQLSPA